MKPIDVTVQQDIVTVQRIFEKRKVKPNDVITIKAAADLLGKQVYTVARWVGKELPEIKVQGKNKRFTLRSAVLEKKRYLIAAEEGGLHL